MTVTIESVRIPVHSSIGFLTGTTPEGTTVVLACDRLSARYIGQDLECGEHVVIEPDYATNGMTILSITTPADRQEEIAFAKTQTN